jgi:hypothetical protein
MQSVTHPCLVPACLDLSKVMDLSFIYLSVYYWHKILKVCFFKEIPRPASHPRGEVYNRYYNLDKKNPS